MKGIAVGGGVRVEAGSESLISSSGASMVLATAAASGLAVGLSRALGSWRPARAVHDPGKTVLDLAVAIALGGDCLADVAVLRAQPQLFGAVASDPSVSRLIAALGDDSAAAIAAIRRVRAAARAKVWGHRSPLPATGPVVVDVDATLVGAHSEKEGATPNFKRGFGFHPILAFVDHGGGGTGEPLAAMLRPGKATANDAADQIAVLDAALAQLPEQLRSRVLVRGDTGSGVHGFVWHAHNLGLQYSVGIYGRQPIQDASPTTPSRCTAESGSPGSTKPICITSAPPPTLYCWAAPSSTGIGSRRWCWTVPPSIGCHESPTASRSDAHRLHRPRCSEVWKFLGRSCAG